MAAWDLLASPPVIFLFALATGCLVYAWSRTVAPRSVPAPGKTLPYIGGEIPERQAIRPGYQFFYVALFFTVADVAALVLATTPRDATPWWPLGYLAILVVAVIVLRWEQ